MADVISMDRGKTEEVDALIDRLVEMAPEIEDMYVVIFYDGKLEMRGTGSFMKAAMASLAINKYTMGLMEK